MFDLANAILAVHLNKALDMVSQALPGDSIPTVSKNLSQEDNDCTGEDYEMQDEERVTSLEEIYRFQMINS